MTSQLERACESLNVRIEAEYGGVDLPHDWPQDAHPYKVTLKLGRRRLTCPFFVGPACGEPTAADVLSSLLMDYRCGDMPFEDFCSDLGYDTDSRKAHATYMACRAMAPRLKRFLGDSFKAFLRAEH